MKEFDAIIIGSGQAGVPLAKKLALAGWKTAIIEKRIVGGTCINDGCTPTKAMVASARLAWLAGNNKELGIEIPSFNVNFEAVMARKAEIVRQFREGSVKGIEKTENLTLIYGDAKFTGDYTLSVKGNDGSVENYTAKHIFINTGESPVIPDIEGVQEIKYLTSTTILELEEVPEHLLIVGGGYIGLEFGQMFSRFGAKVTLLEHGNRLLPKEDTDVCEVVTQIFKEDGIEVFTAAKVTRFENLPDQKIKVTAELGGKTITHSCSHVLLASGRKPQTETLGLADTGIKCDDRGHIQVNEFLETAVKNVFALGDVKGGPAFTHISYNDYIIVANNLLENGKMSTKGRMVPYCMFIDPQLGRIGITETQAIEQGLDYIAAKIPMKNVARAIENGETRGFMKAVVDKNTRQILGATIIGEQGGETMTILQMAMMGKITYDEIRTTIFAHPLYAESLNNLFMSIE
ncbi:mercuric reductase [Pedobacter hartonius]|uniref:Pyruvate/2-oxoglutarate dehydrogenase complex, dihydrolipoamide dehydrogenase (E3) component n=1 Tax=Pedobacter hartonius TaxID=425514 RepID=A0A1H4B4M2_9SPHI|nr:mercuric reductase [Pedobacter hartonius]SEA43049.1 Pyruvate/2-oxoglutarate dehydrogenase complex, dihydrolipoamide dehydrogenase (E3) component [Pedobacter hartonius]